MKKYISLAGLLLLYLRTDVASVFRKIPFSTRLQRTEGPVETKYGFLINYQRTGSEATRLRDAIIAGKYESADLSTIKKFLRPGDLAVDVGAHEGYFTLFMAQQVGPQGIVYACEPNPENLRFIEENAALNHYQNVKIIPKAIGKELTKQKFFFSHDMGAWGSLYDFWHDTNAVIDVEVTTLDHELAQREKPVRLLKVDVEGNDYQVLLGAKTLLEKDRPIICIEVNLSIWAMMGASLQGLFELFHVNHYTLYKQSDRLTPYRWPDERVFNLFAVPAERVAELEQQRLVPRTE